MNDVWIALGLTLFAGLATGIGSAVAFLAKRTNYRFLAVSTGFSAGVMLYVSFVEIFVKGAESLVQIYGERMGHWVNVASFFGGMVLIGLIDNLIPEAENPHETHGEHEFEPLRVQSDQCESATKSSDDLEDSRKRTKLMRMGLFTALAIGIHNFPEGLATFLAALQDPAIGTAIAVAIALHNIPEGISVAVPIYYATGNRKKAFFYSLLSGFAEPVGAVIAFIGLTVVFGAESGVIPGQVMGVLFGGVAGIMVYISLDELLPTSRAYGQGHDSLFGLISGMLVMALSLLLLR